MPHFNTFNLLPIIAAGLMNGSFVVPANYVKRLCAEQIWFYHSLIGLGVLPWLILTVISPHAFHIYTELPLISWAILIAGGFVFGVGQILFIYAIEAIGIASSFTVNLAIGVTLGSLFAVFYPVYSLSNKSYLVLLSILLILLSLVSYYYAVKSRTISQISSHDRRGWMLATFTGLTSGMQNMAFVWVAFHNQTLSQAYHTFWVWPPFLFAAMVPMWLGFRARIHCAQTQLSFYPTRLNQHTLGLILLMGLLFTGSLALYSYGMSQLLPAQQMVGWPLFMVLIILTSQLWGGLLKDLRTLALQYQLVRCGSILLLMIAMILLGIKD